MSVLWIRNIFNKQNPKLFCIFDQFAGTKRLTELGRYFSANYGRNKVPVTRKKIFINGLEISRGWSVRIMSHPAHLQKTR